MKSLYVISIPNLLITLIPLLIVVFLFYHWSLKTTTLLYSTARMLIQLTLIGFVLTFIFQTKNIFLIGLILFIMLFVASWISLRTIGELRKQHFFKALFALFVVAFFILALLLFVVIDITPWYEPRYLLPMAGMILANSMNALSLAAERFHKEIKRKSGYFKARKEAYQAALIPITNMFLAVGLVSLPGMMTGQILAGVDPLIAVRYQIMIMAILYSAAGISTAIYLRLMKS